MSQTQASAIYALRANISTAIAPWRLSRKAPPFSTEQLVAMALLSQDKPMTCQAIMTWINATFPFYAVMVTQAFWERTFEPYIRPNAPNHMTELKEDLDTVLRTYEFPSYINSANFYNMKRGINWFDGIELIRPLLASSPREEQSKFDFFRLPAELRNEIYDIVFQYPTDTGLSFGTTQGKPSVRFEIVNDTSKLRTDLPPYQKLESLCTRPMKKILEPLLTNRQLYNEAMPMFYRNNHFRLADLEDLMIFLTAIPRKRMVHLTHLTIAYPRRDRVNAEKAFDLLTEVRHLRILNFRIEETTWLKYARTKAEKEAIKAGRDPVTAKAQFQSALDMPGMTTLRSIRGLEEVNVAGIRKDTVLPRTTATLRADMTREKPVKAKNSTAKRKTYGDDRSIEIANESENANANAKRLKVR